MLRKYLLIIILILVQFSLVAGNLDMEITSPDSGRVYTTSGSISIVVKVSNPNENAMIYGITVNASCDNGDCDRIAITNPSPLSSLDSKRSASFTVLVVGAPEKRTSIKIEVTASNPQEDVSDDSITVYVTQGEPDIQIVSPLKEINLVDIPENGSTDVKILVRNSGVITLSKVRLMVDYVSGGIFCQVKSSPGTIARASTENYVISCSNITSGSILGFSIQDDNTLVKDAEVLRFNLVERIRLAKLNITSPHENEEFRFGEYGGSIAVTAKNIGEVVLNDVCIAVEGVSFESDECTNMGVGDWHNFTITVQPVLNLTNARITVFDKDNKSKDAVVVRIFKMELILPIQNVTINETPNTVENKSNVTLVPKPKPPKGFEIPQWVYTMVIILIPILIVVAFVKRSITRANKAS